MEPGTIISTSGVLLWALLGPIGALLCIGVRQSVGWFIAWVVLTALSGAADWYLADTVFGKTSNVPVRTTIVFFALNFIAVSALIYVLLRHSIAERRKTRNSSNWPMPSRSRSNGSARKNCCSTSCPGPSLIA